VHLGAAQGTAYTPELVLAPAPDWQAIDTVFANGSDQVVLLLTDSSTVVDFRNISCRPAREGIATTRQAVPRRPTGGEAARTAGANAPVKPDLPIGGGGGNGNQGDNGVSQEKISFTSFNWPGGNGAEPGAEFIVSGGISCTYTHQAQVTVTCENRTYQASVANDATFSVTIRVYGHGPIPVTAHAEATSYFGAPNDPRNGTVKTADQPAVTSTVNLANPEPTISIVVPPKTSLVDGQSTNVAITVTTADTSAFGPRTVSARCANTVVGLSQRSSTQFTGTIALDYHALGNEQITAQVTCSESTAYTNFATGTTQGLDVTPPQLSLVYPHENVPVPLPDLAIPIQVSGKAEDDQSGVQAVRWSLTQGDPNPSVATTTNGWATWSADVLAPAYGDCTVYVTATDVSGNASSLSFTMDVQESYLAQSLDDRLSPRWYLDDLLNFACDAVDGQLTTAPGGGPPTFEEVAAALLQPVDKLSVPGSKAAADWATVSINELRVPVEVLRADMAQAGIPSVSPETPYVQAAYASLLGGLGTTYAALRLARGAAQSDRVALAANLGIALAGPAPGQLRPDQLDALSLDGAALTEEALEQLFGLASSTRPDVLQPVLPALVVGWQTTATRMRWQAQDIDLPVPVAYEVLVDPDLITRAEILVPGIATDLWDARSSTLLAQQTALAQSRVAGASAADQLTAMLALGIPGVDISDLQARQQAGEDIGADLALAGLDAVSLTFLLTLEQLAATPDAQITDAEWTDADNVLVAALRRRSYVAWRQDEVTRSLVLAPDVFQIDPAGPPVVDFRFDAAARQDWVRVLGTRAAEYQGLQDGASGNVAAAETRALPILRDILLTDIMVAAGDASIADTGDRLTSQYQLDMRAGGTLTTERIVVGTVSVQLLYQSVRSGSIVGTGSSAEGWKSVAAFDSGWAVMSDYASWRSAMTMYFFPESFMNPLKFAQATPSFTVLLNAVKNGQVTYPSTFAAGGALDTWEGVVRSWLTNFVYTGGGAPATITYFAPSSSQQATNRENLLAYCTQACTLPDKNTPMEVFWVVPMLFGQLLAQQGQYTDALSWYELAFPFTDPANLRSIYAEVNGEVDQALVRPTYGDNIWTLAPGGLLDPFAFADPSRRTAPFLRATLLTLIECLVEYADAQYTAETDESLALARQLYLQAHRLTGHPCFVKQNPATVTEIAMDIPMLTAVEMTISTRLAQLRAGYNIAGQRIVPVAPVGSSMFQPTAYPYKVVYAQAEQLATQAAQVEAQYTNALSNLDTQNLKLDDANQAIAAANQQVTVQQDQYQSATDGVAVAKDQLSKSNNTIATLQQAISNPVNSYESKLLDNYKDVCGLQDALAGVDAAIGAAGAVATLNAGNAILSAGVDAAAVGVQIGGYAAKAVLQTVLDKTQAQMQANQLMSSVEDRVQAWQMQLSSAQDDVTIATDQVTVANDQQKVASDQLLAAKQRVLQASDTLMALQGQYLSAAMYGWLVQVLGGVYRFFLQQATATARLAQAQLAFDRAEVAQSFIRSDYWQPPAALLPPQGITNTLGLTGAEQLAEDLTSLSQYAFSTDHRRLNISQTFSVASSAPVEFLAFRETGELTFATPMAVFDQDFPGHHHRLIRQVTLSVIALVPPTRGIRATLSNNGISRVTTQATLGGFGDIALRRDPAEVAITSPVGANGVFVTDDQSSLLLPFQGSGVDTTWGLSLPKAANPFDYSSISDVLLTIDYTALSSADYRSLVVRALNTNRTRGGDCVFSLARDFPDQWYLLNNPDDPTAPRSVTVTLPVASFPLNVDGLAASALTMQLASTGVALSAVAVTLVHNGEAGKASTDDQGMVGTRRGADTWVQLFGDPTGDWQLTLDDVGAGLLDSGAIADISLDVTWTGQAPAWPL
jgi:hypothetical protein